MFAAMRLCDGVGMLYRKVHVNERELQMRKAMVALSVAFAQTVNFLCAKCEGATIGFMI